MKKLLHKELRLTAAPITYLFLAFALMTLIPGYPILMGGFFITLGIFYTFQTARKAVISCLRRCCPAKKATSSGQNTPSACSSSFPAGCFAPSSPPCGSPFGRKCPSTPTTP